MKEETKKKKATKKRSAPKKETPKVKEKEEKVVAEEKKETKKETPKKIKEKTKKTSWLGSVFKELKLVQWPSKKDMVKYSIATIVFIIFFALFFYAIELIMAFLKSLI